ncbi:uncharacterized protein LOC114805318 [Zeugodacus cucurbitae]|uniref:uncharacterized protein LOC114805318 n=1 Tax=Zeugodacus cucurbitae TaxID=28588 RepID=UPI0023D920C1|nr:uncharacterized protein LOC114805318 [Zeugodacus cucurbitae]
MLYHKLVTLLLINEIYAASNVYNLEHLKAWNATLPSAPTDLQLAHKACEIAAKYDSYIYTVYTGAQQDNNTAELELNLLKCMAELPTHVTALKALAKEPQRRYNSFSIFVLSTSAAANVAQLQRIVNALNEKQMWKHFHRYAFIWRNAQRTQLHALFSAVWQRKILNAIVITDDQHIYTFEPYTAAGFALKRITDAQYFYDKLKNLHKQQVRITMFKDFLRAIPRTRAADGYTGVDGLLASNIVAYLNATANYTQPADNENYGACLANGSFTGVLRDLIDGAADVSFNARFTLPCAAAEVETLYPYFKRKLYLVVPSAEMQPEYLIFIKAFTYTLWLLLALNFFAVIAIFALLKNYAEHLPHAARMKHGRWYELIEMFLKTQLGEPVTGYSRISSLRQYLITWIYFSYVVTTIYFGKLESSFVQPSYEAELDTLDELPKLDVPIVGVHTLFITVQPALKAAHWHEIEKRALYLPLHFSSFLFAVPVAKRKNWRVAFLLRGETAKDFLIKTYDVQRRRPRFHVVKEYLRSMPQEYILEKGSPFRYKFQLYQAAMFESGLLEYWSSNDTRYTSQSEFHEVEDFYEELPNDLDFDLSEITSTVGGNTVHNRRQVVLSMHILQGAFYLWGCGIFVSIMGFLVEYGYWRYSKRTVKQERSEAVE